MLKRGFLAGAALVAATVMGSSAHAADIYTPPPPAAAPPPMAAPLMTWSGAYIGLHAGYTWGDVDADTNYLPTPFLADAVPFSSSVDMSGFLGGAQIGANWQMDSFVFGVEADISWSGADGSNRVAPLFVGLAPGVPLLGSFQTLEAEMNWFGTARVRAGFAATPELLLYATGGLAFGHLEFDSFTAFAPPGPSPFNYVGSHSTTKAGWTIGAGAEWAVGPEWSLKLEYLYYDLGSTSHTALPQLPNAPFAVTQEFDVTGHIVRAGLNYRFSW